MRGSLRVQGARESINHNNINNIKSQLPLMVKRQRIVYLADQRSRVAF